MNVKEYAVCGIKMHRGVVPSDVSWLKNFDTLDEAKKYMSEGQEAWKGQLVIVEFDKYPEHAHQPKQGKIIFI